MCQTYLIYFSSCVGLLENAMACTAPIAAAFIVFFSLLFFGGWLCRVAGWGESFSGVAVCQAIRALSYFVELKPALAPFDFWASLVFMCITNKNPAQPLLYATTIAPMKPPKLRALHAERLVEFSLILHTRRAIWAWLLTSPHIPFCISFMLLLF